MAQHAKNDAHLRILNEMSKLAFYKIVSKLQFQNLSSHRWKIAGCQSAHICNVPHFARREQEDLSNGYSQRQEAEDDLLPVPEQRLRCLEAAFFPSLFRREMRKGTLLIILWNF